MDFEKQYPITLQIIGPQLVINESFEHGWRQHFPTYHFEKRDIAIEEYKAAAKSLEAEERVFVNASNIAVIASAGLGSLAVGSLDKLTVNFIKIVPASTTLAILVILTCGFSWVALRYFADRQKSVVFAARKVIVLRRMLGLNYGTMQLVLPNWRIEGADEPFAVRLFPGWDTYVTYPFYALASVSSAVLYFLLASLVAHQSIPEYADSYPAWIIIALGVLGWAIFLAFCIPKSPIRHTRKILFIICLQSSPYYPIKRSE